MGKLWCCYWHVVFLSVVFVVFFERLALVFMFLFLSRIWHTFWRKDSTFASLSCYSKFNAFDSVAVKISTKVFSKKVFNFCFYTIKDIQFNWIHPKTIIRENDYRKIKTREMRENKKGKKIQQKHIDSKQRWEQPTILVIIFWNFTFSQYISNLLVSLIKRKNKTKQNEVWYLVQQT